MEKVIEATCSEAIQNLSNDPKYLSLSLSLALLFFPLLLVSSGSW